MVTELGEKDQKPRPFNYKHFRSLYLIVMEIVLGPASPVKGLKLLGFNRLKRR